jgi:hypothetical protein
MTLNGRIAQLLVCTLAFFTAFGVALLVLGHPSAEPELYGGSTLVLCLHLAIASLPHLAVGWAAFFGALWLLKRKGHSAV